MALTRIRSVEVVGMGPACGAIDYICEFRPDVVLLDASLIGTSNLPHQMLEIAPTLKIVAFAVSKIDRQAIECAEAGISGYVTRDGSADDIVAATHRAVRGELVCSPRVTALLFERVAVLSAGRNQLDQRSALTQREQEIVPLIERGLSNKEIARRLRVGTATVKNHVHNILEKLQIRRRGEVALRVRGDVGRRGPAPENDPRSASV